MPSERAAGAMTSVVMPFDAARALVDALGGDPVLANHNSPSQTVIAGTEAGLKAAAEKLQAAGVRHQRIPVACGFHSPLIAGAKGPLAAALAEAHLAAPRKLGLPVEAVVAAIDRRLEVKAHDLGA